MKSRTLIAIVFGAAAAAIAGATEGRADSAEPKTYNDCILAHMTGVTSNVAAFAIKRACREKFPEAEQTNLNIQDMPENSVRQLTVRASVSYFSGNEYLSGNIYNGNEKWTVSEVIIAFRKDKYKVVTKVPPLSNESFMISVKPNRLDALLGVEVVDLYLVGAKGYQ